MDQQASRHTPIARPRHDGWTQDKQVTFIIALRRTHNVSRAAVAAGMSRESAYRFRARRSGAEFAAAWDHALQNNMGHNEGHNRHSPAPPPIGLSAGEHHESHSVGRTAQHRQFHQLSAQERAGHAPSTEGSISPARRADLLARIKQASRGRSLNLPLS